MGPSNNQSSSNNPQTSSLAENKLSSAETRHRSGRWSKGTRNLAIGLVALAIIATVATGFGAAALLGSGIALSATAAIGLTTTGTIVATSLSGATLIGSLIGLGILCKTQKGAIKKAKAEVAAEKAKAEQEAQAKAEQEAQAKSDANLKHFNDLPHPESVPTKKKPYNDTILFHKNPKIDEDFFELALKKAKRNSKVNESIPAGTVQKQIQALKEAKAEQKAQADAEKAQAKADADKEVNEPQESFAFKDVQNRIKEKLGIKDEIASNLKKLDNQNLNKEETQKITKDLQANFQKLENNENLSEEDSSYLQQAKNKATDLLHSVGVSAMNWFLNK